MQEVQGNVGIKRGSRNSHDSCAHVQVPEVRNTLRAEKSFGETFQGVAHVQMSYVPTGIVFLVFCFYLSFLNISHFFVIFKDLMIVFRCWTVLLPWQAMKQQIINPARF